MGYLPHDLTLITRILLHLSHQQGRHWVVFGVSRAEYPDGCIAFQWAVVFADATADAKLTQEIGSLQSHNFAIRVGNGEFLQADGFFGVGHISSQTMQGRRSPTAGSGSCSPQQYQ